MIIIFYNMARHDDYYPHIIEKDFINKINNDHAKFVPPTVNFGKLKNFMTYNDTPSAIHKTIENEVANRLEQMNKGLTVALLMQYLMAAGMFLVMVSIAYMIIQQGTMVEVVSNVGSAGEGVLPAGGIGAT